MTTDAGRVRPAVLAGQFYPADPDALFRVVDECLSTAESFDGTPKAIIAPHAGFIYSGPIAGTAYATIRPRHDQIRRVVLLGPCHRVPVRNFAVPNYRAFATPLGLVPVDQDAVALALEQPGVELRDDAHLPEHCLETQLPFLQQVLDDFSIVPILVGAPTPEATSRLLKALWGGPETLIVVSSDLSHFHDYETAKGLDTAACQAIEVLAPDRLGEEQACGRHAIRGLLARARDLDLRATTLDLRNSGDTAGRQHRESVVGYSAVAFEDARTARHSEEDRKQLLQTAANSITQSLGDNRGARISAEQFRWPLRALRATFVTLKVDGKLRGCVGSAKAIEPLIADVATNAYKAAFGDRRFDGLTRQEFAEFERGMELSISVLSHPRPLASSAQEEAVQSLEPGIDGVILRDGSQGALFLPQVWQLVRDPRMFLQRLKLKAGLDEHHWSPDLQLYRFRAETFGTRIKAHEDAAAPGATPQS